MRKLRRARDTSPNLFSRTISAQNAIVSHVESHDSEPEIPRHSEPSGTPVTHVQLPPQDEATAPAIPARADYDINLRDDIWPLGEPAPTDTVCINSHSQQCQDYC